MTGPGTRQALRVEAKRSARARQPRRVVTPSLQPDGSVSMEPVGQAFINGDGTISVYLDGLPMTGRLMIERDGGKR